MITMAITTYDHTASRALIVYFFLAASPLLRSSHSPAPRPPPPRPRRSAIANLVSNSSVDTKRSEAARNKMRDLEEWMAARRLATALKRDIRRYYIHAWMHCMGG